MWKMKRKAMGAGIGILTAAMLFLTGAGMEEDTLLSEKGEKNNIIVTTPDTLFSYAGYRSVIIDPDGKITDTDGTSRIPLHFHYGNDGNTAFCLGVNLANPDVEVAYQEADLTEAYGDKLEQVSAIVQNSILKFSDDRKSNALPEQWKNLTYEETQYTAQLAIWKTLLGKPGNEVKMDGKGWFNDAWLYQNVYFPRMQNLENGKDIKGFYEYLLKTKTVAQPSAQIQFKEPIYENGFFEIPISVQTKEAGAGTVLCFYNLQGQPKLFLSDNTELEMVYDKEKNVWIHTSSGTIDDTLRLQLSAQNNDESTIQCHVYAKSNAVSSNLVYLIPSVSNYQNLIKVEPNEVKTAEAEGEVSLPKVTANVKIRKVEKGTDQPIGGISFHIWSDNGFDQWVSVNDDGICPLDGLLPGIYQYQEKETDAYVSNQTIYTFTVLDDGRVSGQIDSEQTSFAVENLRYCDLTVIKKIRKDDIIWAHGKPTFLFSVSGTDLEGIRHTYYGTILFDEDSMEQETDSQGYLSLSYTFEAIPMGSDYVVQEEMCNRYLLTNISSEDENVTITKLEEPIYEAGRKNTDFFNVSVDFKEKPTGTSIIFQNEKVRYDDYSHTSFVENRLPIVEE